MDRKNNKVYVHTYSATILFLFLQESWRDDIHRPNGMKESTGFFGDPVSSLYIFIYTYLCIVRILNWSIIFVFSYYTLKPH